MSRTHSTTRTSRRRFARFAALWVAFALALAGLGSSGMTAVAQPAVSNAKSAGNPITDSSSLVTSLEKRGFEVLEGGFKLWGIDECPESYALMGSCFFNNPAAPYILPIAPPWPGEYLDPATQGAFGAMPEESEGFGAVRRLDPNEALIVYGNLPPKAAYFGIQSYLFTRAGEYQTNNDTYKSLEGIGAKEIFFHQVPGNTERNVSFSSLSDSNNNVVIERQSGSSWNEQRYFVITSDRFMDKQVRQVLKKLAVADKDVFTERIPSNRKTGLGADADEFVTGVRYANPSDGGAAGTPSDVWRHEPDMKVLRIRDTRPNRPAQPYPAWEDNSPEPRAGVSEANLKGDLTELVYKVSQTWGQECASNDCVASGQAKKFIDTQSQPFNLVGPKCDNIGMDCQGDTQDATYQFRPGHLFDNGQVYAVVGTLGTETRNATYVSLGVNNTRLRLGARNVDGSELVGSAVDYGVTNADKLYVHYFTRDCEPLKALTRGFCTSVEDSELLIPGSDAASFVERDYIATGTQRGPDSTLTLPSVVLTLRRPVP